MSVIIAHRHFDLSTEEAMVERENQEALISKPALLSEIKQLKAKPNTIALAVNGTWFPVNYCSFVFSFLLILTHILTFLIR